MLDFFISPAFAQEATAAAAKPNPITFPLIMVGMFAIMYFMMIRPQRKRQKEHRDLIAALSKGDEIVTTSGLLGKITGLTDDYVSVDTGSVELKFQRSSVHAILPKGTMKSI